MSVFKSVKTNPTPPTLEERQAAAVALAESTLSIFEEAALDLEDAASQSEFVRNAADSEISRLSDIADSADDAAVQYRDKASKLRSLFTV